MVDLICEYSSSYHVYDQVREVTDIVALKEWSITLASARRPAIRYPSIKSTKICLTPTCVSTHEESSLAANMPFVSLRHKRRSPMVCAAGS